jgi:prepilin-type N-terminal cleavage/methylation domain-containing protein
MMKQFKGFGLIELMISIVLATILMIGIYKYWIKSVTNMSDQVKISTLQKMAQRSVFEIVNELKLVGYNPRSKTDPNNSGAPFGVIAHPQVDDITFSYYNELSDPAYTGPLFTPPTTLCQNPWCTRTRYFVDSGVLKKQFFNSAVNNPIATDFDTMTLLNNTCLRFTFWDSTANTPCACQTGLKCDMTSGNCTTIGANDFPPKVMRLILAALPEPDRLSDFNSSCIIPDLDPAKYIRFEKTIYLTNLR